MNKDRDLEIEDLDFEESDVQPSEPANLEDDGLEFVDLNEDVYNGQKEEETVVEEYSGHETKKRKKFSIHYAFFGIFALIVIFVTVRLIIWNIGTKDDTDVTINNPEYDVEPLDYILPLNPKLLEGREDDGITTVVCLGNAPFADDRNEEDNLASLIEKEMGENTVVYNCSIADSYVTAMRPSFSKEHVYDAFSFYWLTTAFTVDNTEILDTAIAETPDMPEETKESVELLKNIDFETVDVIAVMYDGNDYLGGRKTINQDNPTDIQYFTGALAAGIQLIQNTYPHIRIMVMSPTYAYALDENGEAVDSDLTDYGMGPLSTYAILQSNTCYDNSVSFIDNFFASVNADNASEYLEDHIHLNVKGRKLIAKRFVECLNLYKGVAAENAD